MAENHLIPGREFAPLVGLEYPGPFNAARKQLQMVWDRTRGTLKPYPTTMFDTRGCSAKEAAERRRARKEFEQANILVVPEWGGIKWPKTEWQYDRRKGEALARHGTEALESIGESLS